MARGYATTSPGRAAAVVGAATLFSAVVFALYVQRLGLGGVADLLSTQKRFAEEGVSAGYYQLGVSVSRSAVLVAVFVRYTRATTWVGPLGVVTLAALTLTALFSFATSSRADLLLLLASAGVLSVVLRRREPRPLVLLVLLLVGLTLLGGLREARIAEQQNRDPSFSTATVLQQGLVSRDWLDIGPTSVVVDQVPQTYDYLAGRSLANLVVAPVPRSLWPEKPQFQVGRVVGQVLGFDPDRRTGDPPGIVAELWLNGGPALVVLGMGPGRGAAAAHGPAPPALRGDGRAGGPAVRRARRGPGPRAVQLRRRGGGPRPGPAAARRPGPPGAVPHPRTGAADPQAGRRRASSRVRRATSRATSSPAAAPPAPARTPPTRGASTCAGAASTRARTLARAA